MSSLSQDPRYGVLVPVKRPAFAKSRLLELGDQVRSSLVVAFAVDTINAALESALVDCVLAVTDDHELALKLAELGALVVPDGAVDNLNESLSQAAAELVRRRPELRIAALCADLPALRSEELTRALATGSQDRMSFVADAVGVGTTAVLSPNLAHFRPRFGPGSRQGHLDAGAEEIDLLDVSSLRLDVDTPADLVAAIDLGVGAHTSMLVTGLRL